MPLSNPIVARVQRIRMDDYRVLCFPILMWMIIGLIVRTYTSLLHAHSRSAWKSTKTKKSKNYRNSSFHVLCSLTLCLEIDEKEEIEEF